MDLQRKRSDDGQSIDSGRLIERGHLVLHAIASEAHAARIAAQKAELEVALAEAQGGNTGVLQAWLDNFQRTCNTPEIGQRSSVMPRDLPGVPAGDWDVSLNAQPTAGELKRNWNSILPGAQRRLEVRATQLDVAPPSSTMVEESECLSQSQEGLIETVEEWKLAGDHLDELPERESLVEEPLAFDDSPELRMLAEATREQDKHSLLSGWRGFTVSVLVHLVLISALMTITCVSQLLPQVWGSMEGLLIMRWIRLKFRSRWRFRIRMYRPKCQVILHSSPRSVCRQRQG